MSCTLLPLLNLLTCSKRNCSCAKAWWPCWNCSPGHGGCANTVATHNHPWRQSLQSPRLHRVEILRSHGPRATPIDSPHHQPRWMHGSRKCVGHLSFPLQPMPLLDIDRWLYCFNFTVKLVSKIMSLLGCVLTHPSLLLVMLLLMEASCLGGKFCYLIVCLSRGNVSMWEFLFPR